MTSEPIMTEDEIRKRLLARIVQHRSEETFRIAADALSDLLLDGGGDDEMIRHLLKPIFDCSEFWPEQLAKQVLGLDDNEEYSCDELLAEFERRDTTRRDAFLDTMPDLTVTLLSECTPEEMADLLHESNREELQEFVSIAADHLYDDFDDHPTEFQRELAELQDWLHSLIPVTLDDEEFIRLMSEAGAEMERCEGDSRGDAGDEWVDEGF
jgi:hypothetical protein